MKGVNIVSTVKVKEGESLESALRRFKRQTSRDGVIQEVRKREHYEKPSVKRKLKSEAARKRKRKYSNTKKPVSATAGAGFFHVIHLIGKRFAYRVI